jgi:hypothetical protein
MSIALDLRSAYRACDFLSSNILGALHCEGVDLGALIRRWMRRPELTPRTAFVLHHDDGAFEFANPELEEAVGAVIFPAANEIGDVVDLVAWSPPRPPARWQCRAGLLGAENVLASRLSAGLRVDPDPLTWLRRSCRGVIVLDERRARGVLYRAASLEVASVGQGQSLRRMLEVKPPQILVAPSDESLAA